MKNKITPIVAIITILSLVFLSGCTQKKYVYALDLEIWGVFDSSDAFNDIFKGYSELNPFVGNVKYRKIPEDSYKKELLDALASGEGPDIFMIHNTWLPSFKDKIVEASDGLVNEQSFRDNFVDVVANDFIDSGKIYALPLSVDSLALYYNRDLLNAEGITSPPKTWEEFLDDTEKLTKVDSYGNFSQSGAALGTAYNINRSTDILGLLMFQRGISIVDNKANVSFNQGISRDGTYYSAGEDAWKFYTSFADSGSDNYSWNPDMHYSIDSFYEGKTAMMINYSWHYQTIKNKNPKLNFGVAEVPQDPEGVRANYANYWGFAVAKNKTIQPIQGKPAITNEIRVLEAWEFLKTFTMKNDGKITLYNFMTENAKELAYDADPAQLYTEKTKKPAARRDLIEEQKKDVFLGPFAYGNLIAKSWYQSDPEAIEGILAEGIDSINKGSASVRSAMGLASTRISQLMR